MELKTNNLKEIENKNNVPNTIKYLIIYTDDKNLEIDLNFAIINISSLNTLHTIICFDMKLINISNITTNIQTLSFNNVYLNNIRSYFFTNLTKLESLNITDNNINKIFNYTFKDLSSLVVLELTKNNIKYIESGSFDGLIKLNSLNLNYNSITEFKAGTFAIYNKIGTYGIIKIRGNKLRHIKSGLFISHSIREIDISNNLISSIEINAFNTSQLEVLKVDNNKLSTLDEHVFGNLTNLSILTIFNNTINCNCEQLKWVFNHPILHLLNSSANSYIKCNNENTYLLTFDNCTRNKGIYIYNLHINIIYKHNYINIITTYKHVCSMII